MPQYNRRELDARARTYRQFFGNRMLYKMMLDKYKEYGLLE